MGELLRTVGTICGVGAVTCCAGVIGFLLFAVFTGRALLVPTALSLLPQMLGVGMDTIGGMFDGVFGGGDDNRDDRRRDDNDDDDDAPRRERREGAGSQGAEGQGMSAVDRIRARRQQFGGSGQSLRPREDDAPDSLTPQKRQWQPGGRRGPIEDQFMPKNPNEPDDTYEPDSGGGRIGNRPGRDSRKREWHEDEFFGGAMDDDGDGYADR